MVFPEEIMYKVKISNFYEVESDIAENQHSSYTVWAQPLGALTGCMCKASAPCQIFIKCPYLHVHDESHTDHTRTVPETRKWDRN